MDIKSVFEKRHSIRAFESSPVQDKDITEILWAASLAPTARNVQPWEFIVIKNPKTKTKIAEFAAGNGPFIKEAPVCIAIFCQNTKYYLEDGCAATTQALLCATALGLGACWVAGEKKDYSEDIRKLLGVPIDYRLVSLIALGFAKEAPSPQKRDLKSMVHREKF